MLTSGITFVGSIAIEDASTGYATGYVDVMVLGIISVLAGAMVAPIRGLQGKRFLTFVAMLYILWCLVPPWQYTTHRSSSRRDAGYSLLFDPPHTAGVDGVKIDFGRLFIEWAAIAAMTGLTLFLRKEKKTGL